MQPYFFPYIGYFQLIAAVDVFVIYDNIKYTKKGWINRNRMLVNGKDVMFSIPLRNASDSSHISRRELSENFDRFKLLNQLKGAYAKAPYFLAVLPLLERVVMYREANLFNFLDYALRSTCEYLKIETKIVISSAVQIDHALKGQEKVLAICKALGATAYVNAAGGRELYAHDAFTERGIELTFIRSLPTIYPQFGKEFLQWLSIVDVMMFNSPGDLATMLQSGCVIER